LGVFVTIKQSFAFFSDLLTHAPINMPWGEVPVSELFAEGAK
jgi:hypothetical protein